MTDPVRIAAFVQGTLQFNSRDDVNQRLPYWEVRSDGDLNYVPARSTGAADAAAQAFGMFNMSPPTSVLEDQARGSFGNAAHGMPLQPSTQKAFRQFLVSKGFDGPGITPENAQQWAQRVQNAEDGLLKGENLDDEILRSLTAEHSDNPSEAARQFSTLYTEGTSRPKNALAKVAGTAQRFDSPDQTEAAGAADATGMKAGQQVAATTTPGGASAPAAAVGPGTGAAGGAGIYSGGKAGSNPTATIPATAGPGPGGTNVTPQLLREYVDSDWHLGFNVWLNRFRDAGSASMFLQFLSQKANEYLGQYEGDLAGQALNGQVPQGSFLEFLGRKGMAQPEDVGGKPPTALAPKAAAAPAAGAASQIAGAVGPMPAGAAPLPANTPAVSPSVGQTAGLPASAELLQLLGTQ